MSNENGTYQVREGKFSLNKSTLKHEDGKAHPNWFGETMINGVKYKIAGWTSKSQAGNVYISCTIQEKIPTNNVEATEVDDKDLF
jgi:uncharacterized protein (DUF736 family)